jgi:hypothetical protein
MEKADQVEGGYTGRYLVDDLVPLFRKHVEGKGGSARHLSDAKLKERILDWAEFLWGSLADALSERPRTPEEIREYLQKQKSTNDS